MPRRTLLALALSCLAAGWPAGAQEAVRLRLEVPAKSVRGPGVAADRAILESFLAAHPEVRIEPVTKLRMEGPRAEAVTYMSMAGESAPDALYVYQRSIQKYIEQGFLYPLDEYLGNEWRRDRLFRKLLPGVTGNGRIYGVPALVAVHALLYRKDLFQQAGLNPDQPPRTWEELLDYARRLTRPERGQHGLILPGGGGAGWRFSDFVWQAGGDIVRRQEDGSYSLALDQPRLLSVYRLAATQPPRVEIYRFDPGADAGAWAPFPVDASLVDVQTNGAWCLALEEPGHIRVCLQPDGSWAADKLPSVAFQPQWTAPGFKRWEQRHLAGEMPAGVRALSFYRDLRWGKWRTAAGEIQGCLRVESAGGEGGTLFNEGRIGMMLVSTTGDIGRYIPDPSQVGLAPLPSGPELDFPDPDAPNDATRSIRRRLQATMLEGEYWGINSQIGRDKARRDATWGYVRHLVGDDARRIRTRLYVETGWAMSVMPRDLERFGYVEELRQMPREWITFYDQLVQYGQPEPFAPGYDQVSTEGMAQIDEVLFDEKTEPGRVIGEIVHRANTVFFGRTPADVVVRRRHTANLAFAGLAVVMLALPVWRLRRRPRAAARAGGGDASRSLQARSLGARLEVLAWLFLLPAVLTILVWAYYPLIRGAVLAFMDYRILSASRFVWLDNFIEAFTQVTFWRALGQTAVYAGLSLACGFMAPIILAILLAEIPFLRLFFRTLFYLPAVTSGLVVMFIWKMMYDPSAQGILNGGLRWLANTRPGHALLIAGGVGVWLIAVGLFSGFSGAWLRSHETRGRAAPAVLLLLAAPLAFDALVEIVAGAAGWPGLLGVRLLLGRVDAWGLSVPVACLLHGAFRAFAVVLAILGVRLWKEQGRAANAILYPAVAVMAVSLAFSLGRALHPMTNPYAWLQDPTGYWAMLWVVLPGIWAGAGPACIIYLAAIQSIPSDLYEAADVDGAGPFDKTWHVTLHYLKPLIIINFIGAFVGTFHAMENILVMTGGGPGFKTMTMGMDIFFNAFTHLKFGYATAEAWILGSLLIGFTVYQLRILKTLRFTRAE